MSRSIRTVSILSALCVLIFPMIAEGQISFDTRQDFHSGLWPDCAVMGDFNKDGFLDLVVAVLGESTISLHLGNGEGELQLSRSVKVGTTPDAITSGDFNEDGNLDVAVGTYNSASLVTLCFGDGKGDFPDTRYLYDQNGEGARGIAAADLNNDGHLDIVTANYRSYNVSLFLGDGAGNFGSPFTVYSGLEPRELDIADFNRDGNLDVVVINSWSWNITVFFGDGAGSLTMDSLIESHGFWPWSGHLGNFNGDEYPDLAVANFGTGPSDQNISVFFGNDKGKLNWQYSLGAGEGVGLQPWYVSIGDLNLDGNDDLMVANSGGNTLSLFLGDGAGNFAHGGFLPVPAAPHWVHAGQFDRDAFPDLVSASYAGYYASIYLSKGNGSFKTPPALPTGENPRDVLIQSIDCDLSPDILTANEESNSLSLFISDGNGGFSSPITLEVGSKPTALAAGPLDEGGSTDIAAANFNDNNVTVLLGNGTGAFTPSGPFEVGAGPRGIALGDFNNDSNNDLAVANFSSGTVTLLQGAGDGTFTLVDHFSAESGSLAIVAADFNGDSALDVATANYTANKISILLGTGTGSLSFYKNITVSPKPNDLACGDFSGDSIIDLAVPCSGGKKVHVLVGAGDGDFSKADPLLLQWEPLSIAVDDFDLDGRSDLAVSTSSQVVAVFRGLGNAAFHSGHLFQGGPGPLVAAAAGDLNSDGLADMAIANNPGNTLSILMNRAPLQDVLCRWGNVNTRSGFPYPTLLLNGSSGDSRRVVTAPAYTPIRAYMKNSISGPFLASFVLYGFPGEANAGHITLQPAGLGSMCFPTPLSGGNPQPVVLVNNIGFQNMLGYPILYWIPYAPTRVFFHPPGLPSGTTITFQGFIVDYGSSHSAFISITNAAVLKVE